MLLSCSKPYLRQFKKKMCKYFLSIISLLCFIAQGYCQGNTGIVIDKKEQINPSDKEILEDSLMSDRFVLTKAALRLDQPLDEQLISIDSIVAIAKQLHPAIASQRGVVEREKANHAHEKIQWTRNIYGTGFYFQGNTNALVTSTVDANASTSLSNGARYGLTVQLPLYEVVGRKRKIKMAKLNYEAQELRLNETYREIEAEVTLAYGNLISAQKLFTIAADGLQSSNLNRENAQNEFENGLITLAELSRILEIDLRIRTDYERARAQFYNAFHYFEIVVGKKIEELVK